MSSVNVLRDLKVGHKGLKAKHDVCPCNHLHANGFDVLEKPTDETKVTIGRGAYIEGGLTMGETSTVRVPGFFFVILIAVFLLVLGFSSFDCFSKTYRVLLFSASGAVDCQNF